MLKLKVEEKKDNKYFLTDRDGNRYELNFEFFDIEKEPEKSDYISIPAELLNPNYKEYSSYLSFGGLKNICGRNGDKLDDTDIIKLEIDDKEIYLKRLYG